MYIYPYLYPPKVTTLVVVSQFKASSGRGYRWNSDSSFCCFHENIPQSARRFSSSVPFPVVVAHPCCRRFSCPPNSQFPRTPVPAWYYTRLTPSLSSPGLLSLSLSPRSRLAHASLTPRSRLAQASLTPRSRSPHRRLSIDTLQVGVCDNPLRVLNYSHAGAVNDLDVPLGHLHHEAKVDLVDALSKGEVRGERDGLYQYMVCLCVYSIARLFSIGVIRFLYPASQTPLSLKTT